MRTSVAILTISCVALATFGITLSIGIPDTPDDAYRNCQPYCAEVSPEYVWTCPTLDGSRECTLVMEIPEEVFSRSMHADIFRSGSVFSHAPSSFVLPDDEFIQIIAQHIDSETVGLSQELKATAALWFVQCTITYAYDSDLFGTENFWAYPVETLFLHRGDCEDTSVLLASILEAMGFDTVLLDYPGHVAVGVKLDSPVGPVYALEDGAYCFCETTFEYPEPIGYGMPGSSPDNVWHPSYDRGLMDILNSAASGYRYLLQRIFSI